MRLIDEEVKEGIVDELQPKQRARVYTQARSLRQRSGYKKLLDFVCTANELYEKHFNDRMPPKEYNPPYVWVDTCCINKESSSELSEAINSMCSWYSDATFCIAIFSDVTSTNADLTGDSGKSRWFTRGWTLQELLAPSEVVFYNVDNIFIGSKTSLANEIENITSLTKHIFLAPSIANITTEPP